MTDSGFLAIDKPAGPSSHDVVARVRRATGVRRVGHAGTLDPPASGLLVVALGRATRLIRFIQDLPKEYVATARFGIGTDTLDATGEVVETTAMAVSADDVRAALGRFTGTVSQVPPMVSALKVGGERLYRIARRGEEVERAARPVEILELELLDFETSAHPLVTFRVVCGKGTYVRSLADDVARSLGGPAHLVALRRTRVGPFAVGPGAVSLDDLDRWPERLVAPAEALAHLPSLTVPPSVAEAVRHGRAIDAPAAGTLRVLDEDGRLLAVYVGDGSRAVPEVVVA